MSDEETKESLGEYLRRHREASGKTIEGIARITRISKRFLQALEDNDMKHLPEMCFARGFLKAYAKEIGLDVDDCILKFDQFHQASMPTQVREVKKTSNLVSFGEGFEPIQKQKWIVWGLSGGVIVAGLVAGILLLIQAIEHKSSRPTSSDSRMLDNQDPNENVIEAPPAVADASPAQVAPSLPMVVKETAKVVEAPPSMATPVKPSTLSVKANRDSKLSIRVDENGVQEYSLKAGETQTFSIFKEVEIRSQDRTAFAFQYNGKPLDISGPVIKLFNRNLFNKKP